MIRKNKSFKRTTMMKKKNTPRETMILSLILGGVIFFFISINGTGFLGSIITTCENNEPTNQSGIISTLPDISSIIQENNLYVSNGTKDYDLPTTEITSSIGIITLSTVNDCEEIISFIQTLNNTESLRLENKNMVFHEQEYYWCNKENNLLFLSNEIKTFDNYLDHYTSCTTIETVEQNETITSSTSSEDEEKQTFISEENKITDNKYNDRYYSTIAITLALMITLYYVFEKGPKKGLIKKWRKPLTKKSGTYTTYYYYSYLSMRYQDFLF